MLLSLLSASLLFAAPAATPKRPAIAVTRFKLVQVSPELGGYAEDRLAQRLTERGYEVTTPADLETVLGLDRQRALLGCNEETSCYAELSAALGVPLLIAGRLTRLGGRIELDVRVIKQSDGKVTARDSRGADDEAKLGGLIAEAAEALADQLGAPAASTPVSPPKPISWRLWGPVAGGVLALAGGGVLLGFTQTEYLKWTSPSDDPSRLTDGEISSTYQRLARDRALSIGLFGLGAAAIATGIVWHALTPEATVTPSVSVTSGGATLTLQGSF